jgi:uncharacterized surface protein with fasciclin (FAS1) repeats
MKKLALVSLSCAMISSIAFAASDPMVGGAAMLPSRTIVQNASEASNLTTLVSAVKQADLVDTLNGAGPFTVFAPTNTAFKELPSGTVDNLMKPDEKTKLKEILTYHVVKGKYDSDRLLADIKLHKGKLELKTVEGADLIFISDGGKIKIEDAKGNKADITTPNVEQKNGVVHVIDRVLMPKM